MTLFYIQPSDMSHSSITILPTVISNMIITYLRYADYSDEEIRKYFSISVVIIWRKASNVKNGFANLVRHSIDDLPCINIDNGKYLEWYKDGLLHRDGDKPAHINNGHEKWYKNGELYRDALPEHLHSSTGIHKEVWYRIGEHRYQGKDLIFKNGKIKRKNTR